jgi:hypothetical protein
MSAAPTGLRSIVLYRKYDRWPLLKTIQPAMFQSGSRKTSAPMVGAIFLNSGPNTSFSFLGLRTGIGEEKGWEGWKGVARALLAVTVRVIGLDVKKRSVVETERFLWCNFVCF